MKASTVRVLQKAKDLLDKYYNNLIPNLMPGAYRIDKIAKCIYLRDSQYKLHKVYLKYLHEIYRHRIEMIDVGSTNRPIQIVDKLSDNLVYSKTVLIVLRISRKELKKMVKKGIFHSINDNVFYISEINTFIKKNYRMALHKKLISHNSNKIVTNWWDVKETKKMTNLTDKQLQRLRIGGKISSIQIGEKKFLYFPPEIETQVRMTNKPQKKSKLAENIMAALFE